MTGHDEASTRDDDDDERPVIHASIRVKKGLKALPGFAGVAWNALKAVLLAGFCGLVLWIVAADPEVTPTLRWIAVLGALYGLYDRLVVRPRLGTFLVLVTDRGVLFSEHQLYLGWDEIESYQIAGDLLRVRPEPDSAPRGLLAPRDLDVPLTAKNRAVLTELFRTRAPRWKP